jgi:2-iminobutanoate/2-iminopropanoate deaminase
MKNLLLLFTIILIFVLKSTAISADKNIIFTGKAPKPIGPYSQAVLVGNTIYLSGQIAIDSATNQIVKTDIKSEAKIVLNNIKVVLEAAGFQMKNIVKTSIFMVDLANFAVVNEVYASFFEGDYPARETIQVAALPKKANVEISVIAVK